MSANINYISREYCFNKINNKQVELTEQFARYGSSRRITYINKDINGVYPLKKLLEVINEIKLVDSDQSSEKKDLLEIKYQEIQADGTSQEKSWVFDSSNPSSDEVEFIAKQIEVSGFQKIKIISLKQKEFTLTDNQINFLKKHNFYSGNSIDASFFETVQIYNNFHSYEDLKIIYEIYSKANKPLQLHDIGSKFYLECIQNFLRIAYEKNEEEMVRNIYSLLFLDLENQTNIKLKYHTDKITILINGKYQYDDFEESISFLSEVLSNIPTSPPFALDIQNCNFQELKPFLDLHARRVIQLNILKSKSIDLKPFVNLEELSLSEMKISTVKGMGQLPNLTKLKMDTCEGWESLALANAHKIQNLKLISCDTNFSNFNQFDNLNKLSIINDESLVDVINLDNLHNLKALKIDSFRNLNSITAGENSNLTNIKIINCENLKGPVIFDKLSKLKVLEIAHSGIALPPKIAGKEIRTIKLEFCRDLILAPDLSECPNLAAIKIYQCKNVKGSVDLSDNIELKTVKIKNCPHLERISTIKGRKVNIIDLSECTHLENPPDVSQCPNLLSLNLSHTHIRNTPNTLGLKNINSVDLRDCPNLDPVEAKNYYESYLPKDPDLQSKCEGPYICSNKQYDPDANGYIYEITPGKIILQDNTELFPAVQPESFDEVIIDELAESLGYKRTLDKLLLPSVNVLNYRWKKLKPQNITLDFIDSEGVADDRSFVETFLDNKMNIAFEKENIHDHTAHALMMISLVEDSLKIDKLANKPPGTSFNKEMDRFKFKIREISNHLDYLKEYIKTESNQPADTLLLEELRTCLGMVVDGATNISSLSDFKTLSIRELVINAITPKTPWYNYFSKRYGLDEHKNNLHKLQAAWFYLVKEEAPFSPKKLMEIINTAP